MSKKYAAIILAACMVIGLLSACGGTAGSVAASAPEDVSEAVSAPESAEAAVQEETLSEDAATADSVMEDSSLEDEGVPYDKDTFAEEAGVFPICDPGEKTITIWNTWFPFFTPYFDGYSDTLFFQEMEKRTGVKTEFTLANMEQGLEQFNMMVAAGDYRDLIQSVDSYYVGGLDNAWDDGVIIPIDDVIDEWMPNYKSVLYSRQAFLDDLTSDAGNIYQFSIVKYVASFPDYGLLIRGDWLDKLGMERPQTYDEYYDVLTAFKNQCGASAPMMLSNSGGYMGNFFCSGFGVYGSTVGGTQPFYQVDGVVKYGPMEEGYKKYLQTMSKWYAEGLIYQDFYTYYESNIMPPDGLVTGDQMGVFGANCTDIPTRYNTFMGTNDALHMVAAYDPVENRGETLHFSSDWGASANGGYCVSTKCEDLETVGRWADYIYSEDGQLLGNFGVEGETFYYDDEGEPMLSDLVLHNEVMPTMLAITKYTSYNLVGVEDVYRMYADYTPEQWESGEIWSLGDDLWTIPRGVSMTSEETESFSAYYSDISTYVGEHTLSIILGKEDVDAVWDEYVANIESMGISTCLAQKQSAYDRYME